MGRGGRTLRALLMIRNCYLASYRAMEATVRRSAVALRVPLPPPVHRDPQRELSGADKHDHARVPVGREPVDPGDHAMKRPRTFVDGRAVGLRAGPRDAALSGLITTA